VLTARLSRRTAAWSWSASGAPTRGVCLMTRARRSSIALTS
jgi:hypothetical protein